MLIKLCQTLQQKLLKAIGLLEMLVEIDIESKERSYFVFKETEDSLLDLV